MPSCKIRNSVSLAAGLDGALHVHIRIVMFEHFTHQLVISCSLMELVGQSASVFQQIDRTPTNTIYACVSELSLRTNDVAVVHAHRAHCSF